MVLAEASAEFNAQGKGVEGMTSLAVFRRWALCLAMITLTAACGGGDDGGGSGELVPCGGVCAPGQACIGGVCQATGDTSGGTTTPPMDTGVMDDAGDEDAEADADGDAEADTSEPDTVEADTREPDTGPECATDQECDLEEYCDVERGSCREGCRDDSSCAANETCDLERRRCAVVADYCDSVDPPGECIGGFFCCPTGNYCDLGENRCAEGCYEDGQCPFGLPCVGASDVQVGQCGCNIDDDCGDNAVCRGGRCEAVACRADDFEPNNSPLTASDLEVTIGSEQAITGANFCDGDVDHYGLWVVPGVGVTGSLELVDATGLVGWRWLAPDDAVVAEGDSTTPSWDFVTDQIGTYVLELRQGDPPAATPQRYTVRVSLADVSIDCDPDGPVGGVTRLSLEETNQTPIRSLCPDAEDVYRVEMTRPGQSLSARLTRRDNLRGSEMVLELVDGGEVVQTASGPDFNLEVSQGAVSGTPEVRVRMGDGATPLGARYQLTLESGPGDGSVCIEDGDEDNDTQDTAAPLSVGSNPGKVICAEDSADWFVLDADANEAVEVQVVYEGDVIPQVRLTLPDDREVVGQTSRCVGDAPCVRFPALSSPEAGEWSLLIESDQGVAINYRVEVATGASCDPTAWSGGCVCTPDARDFPFASEPGVTPVAVPGNRDAAPEEVATGTLCGVDDEDAFPMWTPPGSGLRVMLENTGGGGAALIEIINQRGEVAASGAAGEELEVSAAPEFRRWTVSIRHSDGGAFGYRLMAALLAANNQATCVDDLYEGLERDRSFDLGPAYGTWTLLEPAVLCGDDRDRFRFTNLREGDSLMLRVRRLWPTDNRIDVRLSLDGEEVSAGQERDGVTELTIPSLGLGEHTLDVEGLLSAPAYGLGYRVEAALGRPAGGCVNEDGEPNDDADAALALASGWTYGGVLCRQIDPRDVYTFDAAEGEQVFLRYIGGGGASVTLTGPDDAPVPGQSPETCGQGLNCLEFGPFDAAGARVGAYTMEVRADLLFQDIPYRVELRKAPLCGGDAWQDGCVCVEDALADGGTGSREEPEVLPWSPEPRTVEGLTLCGESEDWFRFEGNARGQRVSLSFTQTRDVLVKVEMYGDVLGNTLLAEGFADSGELTFDNPTFSDLWIRVAHVGDGVGYSFTYSADPIPVCVNDDREPNDDPAAVNDFQSIANTESAIWDDNTLCGPGDADWFQVDFIGFDDSMVVALDRVSVGESVDPEYVNDGIGTQALRVDVLDGTFQLLDSVTSADEQIEFRVNQLLSGTYWLRVQLAQPIAPDGAQPRYGVLAQHEPGSPGLCDDDDFEPNDVAPEAERLSFDDGERITLDGLVACGGVDDPDWFVFTALPEQEIRVEVSADTLEELEVELRDSGEVLVQQAEIRSPCTIYGRCYVIDHVSPATADWFIRVGRRDAMSVPLELDYSMTVILPQEDGF